MLINTPKSIDAELVVETLRNDFGEDFRKKKKTGRKHARFDTDNSEQADFAQVLDETNAKGDKNGVIAPLNTFVINNLARNVHYSKLEEHDIGWKIYRMKKHLLFLLAGDSRFLRYLKQLRKKLVQNRSFVKELFSLSVNNYLVYLQSCRDGRDPLVEALDKYISLSLALQEGRKSLIEIEADLKTSVENLEINWRMMAEDGIFANLEGEEVKKAVKDLFHEMNLLVVANAKFAISFSKRRYRNSLPLVDRIQAAMLGLHESSFNFDPRHNVTFLTVATYWMKLRINDAYRCTKHIHLSAEDFGLVRNIYWKLVANPNLSIKQLAEILKVKQSNIEEALKWTQMMQTVSIDHFSSESDSTGLIHTLDTSVENEGIELADHEYDKVQIVNFLGKQLTNTQFEALKGRLGLGDDNQVESLAKVGKRVGRTREAIRLAQIDGIKKIKEVFSDDSLFLQFFGDSLHLVR